MKRRVCLLVAGAVVTMFVCRTSAQVPNRSTLYLAEESLPNGNDILRKFKDGVLTTVGTIGFGDVRGLGYDPTDGVLFGVTRTSNRLLRVSRATGAGTAVSGTGYLAAGSNTAEITVDAAGIMLGAGHVGDLSAVDTLLLVNKAAGFATPIGNFGVSFLSGLAVDRSSGMLYGTTFNGTLYAIDRTSGGATLIGQITGSNGGVARIAFDPATHVLYGITFNEQLVSVDLTTLVATEVAQFSSATQMYAMDFVPRCSDGELDPGEQCDDGNTQSGDCCSSTCQFESSSTVCRSAVGECDLAEVCTGTSATCPADAKSTAVCRPAAGQQVTLQFNSLPSTQSL